MKMTKMKAPEFKISDKQYAKGAMLYDIVSEAFPELTRDLLKCYFAAGPSMSSYPAHSIYISSIISKRKTMQEIPKFLDLGCGKGLIVALASYMGCESYGIEYHKKLVEFSKKGLEEVDSKLRFNIEPRINYGNFFPKDFKLERLSSDDDFKKWNERHFYTSRDTDAYSELGIHSDQIDIFYHYQIQDFNSVIRFFSEYAKHGSWLLFAPSVQFIDKMKLPENIHLMNSRSNFLYLFEKQEAAHKSSNGTVKN